MSRRAWSAADDATALALHREGKSADVIARRLRRTAAAVTTRLHKLRDSAGSRQACGRRAAASKITDHAAIDAFLRKPPPCR